jgi:tRNA-modifying protein YgfZ
MTNAYGLGIGTVVRFCGKDRCRVVNNLCTQDLRKLTNGQALETFVTDVKGRTYGHGIVPDQGAKLVPHFDRYIIREDAQVTDASQEYQFWLFEHANLAAEAMGVSVERIPLPKTASLIESDGNSFVLISAAWVEAGSVLCLAPAALDQQWMANRIGQRWIVSDMGQRLEWEKKRIAAFWPWYGVDMDDRNLPQEVDRNDTAISFNKGCYLGQETIARLDMLGQVQKKLVRLNIDSRDSIAVSSLVQSEGKDVGTLTSVATDVESGNTIALAYVKRSHFKTGQTLSLGGMTATVVGHSVASNPQLQTE